MHSLSRKEKFIKNFIYVFLFFLIVSGNTLTFQLFGRAVIKISDIAAIVLGLIIIKHFFNDKLSFSVGIMLLWGMLSVFLIIVNTLIYGFTLGDVFTAVLYLFRFLYMLWLAKITADWLRERNLVLPVLKYINILYLLTCFLGFLQLFFYPVAYDYYKLFLNFGVYFPNPDPHVGRLLSTYFDPNYYSSCLLVGVCVNYYLMGKTDKAKGRRNYFYWAALFVYIITILLTKSRSGVLGFAVMTVVHVVVELHKKRITIWMLIALTAVCGTTVFLFCFSNISVFVRIREVFTDPSAQARFGAWKKAFKIMKDTNYFGIGYNLYGAYQKKMFSNVLDSSGYGNDSSLLFIIITTGIAGFILFAMHLWNLASHKKLPGCAVGLLIAALIICNFNNLLFYNLWVFPFYFILFLMQRRRKAEFFKTIEEKSL